MLHKEKALVVIGILSLLTGCGDPKSPGEVSDTLSRRYRGRPVNEFFADFGLPSGEFTANNQTMHIYRWDSSRLYLPPPAEAHPLSCLTVAGNYQAIDTYRGAAITHYCELRIFTDNLDHIRKFAVAVDSTGKWSASRCSELFSNP